MHREKTAPHAHSHSHLIGTRQECRGSPSPAPLDTNTLPSIYHSPHFPLPKTTDPAIFQPLAKKLRRLALTSPSTRQKDREPEQRGDSRRNIFRLCRQSPDSPAHEPRKPATAPSLFICRWPCQLAAAPVLPSSRSLTPLSASAFFFSSLFPLSAHSQNATMRLTPPTWIEILLDRPQTRRTNPNDQQLRAIC